MKKKLILLPFISAVLYFMLSSYSEGPYYYGGVIGTGATGSTGCSCHNSSSYSSLNVSVQLQTLGGTPVTSYVGGTTYNVVITGSLTATPSPTLPRFGFQMSVVKASGAGTSGATNAGSLPTTTSGWPTGTHVVSTGTGIQIFEQYNGGSPGALLATSGSGSSGTTYQETIHWTAPATGTGSVVIYGVINAVDYDGSDDPGTPHDRWNTTSLSICESVGSITGTPVVCAGATTTLNCTPSGGAWSSGSTGVATVGSSSGIVSGVSGSSGTALISYNGGCAGIATQTVTVNAAPSAITGTFNVCTGGTTSLFNSSGSGSWSSGSTSVATVGSTGVVSGVSVSGGVAPISFTLTGTGCSSTSNVTVNPLPPSISGVSFSVCQGATISLSSGIGGVWVSSNTGVATVSTSGIVTGVVTGSATSVTSVITYTSLAGCSVSATVTVNGQPAAITGNAPICAGGNITLADASGTGSWSSASPGVASIVSGSGFVSGVTTAGGTSAITFTLASTGCTAATIVTVNPSPASISGTLTLCPGATTTLSDGGSGSWTSGNTSVATIGSSSGLAAAVTTTGGTTPITYTLSGTGCTTVAVLTVTATPPSISGTLAICQGTTTTLTDGAGTWTSGNTAVATIGSSTGNMTGVVTGSSSVATTLITYTAPGGCSITAIATVDPLPASISGPSSVCQGASVTLSDVTGGGVWSSSDASVASVGTGGAVLGVLAAGVTISYTLPATGCAVAYPLTVNPLPSAISGTTHVCIGGTTSLIDIGGGIWSSSDVTTATVGSTGIVTGVGVTGGIVNISYTLPATGCARSVSYTVNPLPSAIAGSLTVCSGAADTLSDAGSGTWSSSNTSAAPVGATTGIVSAGSVALATVVTITYTLPTGCSRVASVTVDPLPSTISGATHVCQGSNITLSDAGGGTWSSDNAAVGTIGSVSGTFAGRTPGTADVTYTLATGCSRTIVETVNPLPSGISGSLTVCHGLTTTLTDAGGGTWSSGNTSVAPVGSSSGIVTGGTPGTATITYSLATGCAVSAVVTVDPFAAISGVTSICSGLSSALSDAVSGGVWSSGNTSVATIGTSGSISALTPGISVITYALSTGCVATSTLNVISAPTAISGTAQVCQGSSVTLSDAGGGSWSSSAPATASVGSSSGIVSGLALGTATITYSLGTGCTALLPVTVDPAASAITGVSHLCAGASATLTDGGGGSWATSAASVASVSSSGGVTGVTAGVVDITYTLSTGCFAVKVMTVNALPEPISGALAICVGTTTSLSDTTSGGTWSSSSTIASISSAGSLSGLATGTSIISYFVGATGCASAAIVTVSAAPPAISGPAGVCPGSTITLTDGTTGGTWMAGNANATVGSSGGVVTGVTVGACVISYTTPIGCVVTRSISVDPLPSGISGTPSVCAGSTATFTDGGGGTWAMAATGFATVGSTSGIVTGVTAGTAFLTYTLSTGCATSELITVNAAPATITGITHTCIGSASALSDAGGGTWSSSAPGATVDASGNVTGVTAGAYAITYTLPVTGCHTSVPFTVNPLPATISGATSLCAGATASESDLTGFGAWSSSNVALATIGSSSGSVVGVSAGTPFITYMLPTGCLVARMITVDPLPATISGPSSVCVGSTITLSDATSGGTWSVGSSATVDAFGDVTAVSAGTVAVSYTAGGCSIIYSVTLDPLPLTISGTMYICPGGSTSLFDAGGGTWSSSDVSVATAGTSGVISAVGLGVDTITYTLPTGCARAAVVTVDPFPVAGTVTGTFDVCVGAHSVLSDSVSGGVWSSAHTGVASISSSGSLSAVTAGIDTITYRVTNVCGSANAFAVVTVDAIPSAGTISGSGTLCTGSSATLVSSSPGGVWTVGNSALATVGSSTGVVSGVAPGIDTIYYTVANHCGAHFADVVDTVVETPSAGVISGKDTLCVGDTTSLSDTLAGGSWLAGNGNVTIAATGLVTAITAGIDTVTYAATTMCGTVSAAAVIYVKTAGACNAGVKQLASEDEFLVYPDPNRGRFTVQLPSSQGSYTITVCDMLGRLVVNRTVNGSVAQKVDMVLGNVVPGTYIFKAEAGSTIFRQQITVW
jgi:trimeric autotransporter adhesin